MADFRPTMYSAYFSIDCFSNKAQYSMKGGHLQIVAVKTSLQIYNFVNF